MTLVITEGQLLVSQFIVTIGTAEHPCVGLVAVEELLKEVITDYEAYHGHAVPNDFISIRREVTTEYLLRLA